MLDDGIKFCIEQELPAAVYVSTDQLDDMKRFSKVYAIFHLFYLWFALHKHLME